MLTSSASTKSLPPLGGCRISRSDPHPIQTVSKPRLTSRVSDSSGRFSLPTIKNVL